MKKTILAVFFTICWVAFLNAQVRTTASIENVKAMPLGEKIEINFSITNASRGEKVSVELKFRIGSQVLVPKTLIGSTNDLSNGNYTIIWDVSKDVDELDGKLTPVMKIVKTTSELKALSPFTPGFKNKNQVLATASYVSLLAGAYMYYNYNSNYTSYKNELNDASARKNFYDKAAASKSQALVLVGAGVALFTTNVVLARLYNKKYNLASLSYKDGGLCLSYTYTFPLKRR